jgi:hypothetical protein
MKSPRIVWIILFLATACVYLQPASQPDQTARIKIENDGGLIAGMNTPAATAFGYDPYFIHENSIAQVSVPIAKTEVEAK